MFHFVRFQILLFIVPAFQCGYEDFPVSTYYGNEIKNIYKKMLTDIHTERQFDSLLILQQQLDADHRLEEFYRFPVPKMSISPGYEIPFQLKFNSNILAVIIMDSDLDYKLMQTLAETLIFMRQTRIATLALNTQNQEDFKRLFLKLCEKYKMTNVLLHFIYTNQVLTQTHYKQLQPYPLYHWIDINIFEDQQNKKFYPQHWLNMQNKTLITFTDQTIPRSLLFKDSKGNLQFNGYVARMVLLFADHFNVSLQMYQPLKVGEIVHFTVLIQMTRDDKLDIPMAVDSGGGIPDSSDFIELGQGMLMVPCSTPMTTREIFGVLLDANFFTCLILCSLTLSIAHTLIDLIFLNFKESWNFVLNHHVLPGILGLSFVTRTSPLKGLRIVYFLIGFVGINITSLFSGNLNMFLTMPPYHHQISTFDDITKSSLKILLDPAEAVYIMNKLKPIKASLLLNSNTSFVLEARKTFNTTYGYYVSSTLWNLYAQQQQFFTYKSFCTPKGLTILDDIPWGMRLQHNSPYKEAMNHLVHRVHAAGLIKAWQASTFRDLLKLKQISIRDPQPREDRRVLNVNDFFWIWMIVVVGLAISWMVCLVELLVATLIKINKNI